MILADAGGTERHRFEGFLPADDFLAQLKLGLAHAARSRNEWADAAKRYQELADDPKGGEASAEALYWAGVSRYKTGDQSALADTARRFKQKFTDSSWAKKASVWG